MAKDDNSTQHIIEILGSANPTADLKDAVYANLGERMSVALDAYKQKVAESYFGQGLDEGIISQYKQSAADRRADENRPEDDDEYGPGPWPKKKLSAKAQITHDRTQRSIRSPYMKDDIDEAAGLQELSKKTLGSYIKKASHDITVKGAATREFANRSREDRKNDNFVGARKNMALSDKTFDKSWKRRTNMAKAVDRLTKEDVTMDEGKSLLTKIHRAINGKDIARDRADKHEKAAAAERYSGPKGLNGIPVRTKNPDQKKIDRLDRAATRNYRIARGAKPFLTGNSHYMDDELHEAVKKAKTPREKQKVINAFIKAGKYRPDSKLRFAPLKFKKDRKSAREMSQARYNSSPESEAYWSS